MAVEMGERETFNKYTESMDRVSILMEQVEAAIDEFPPRIDTEGAIRVVSVRLKVIKAKYHLKQLDPRAADFVCQRCDTTLHYQEGYCRKCGGAI